MFSKGRIVETIVIFYLKVFNVNFDENLKNSYFSGKSMSQRSDTDIGRILRPREHEVEYGGEVASDLKEDYIEDQDSSDTEVSF